MKKPNQAVYDETMARAYDMEAATYREFAEADEVEPWGTDEERARKAAHHRAIAADYERLARRIRGIREIDALLAPCPVGADICAKCSPTKSGSADPRTDPGEAAADGPSSASPGGQGV